MVEPRVQDDPTLHAILEKDGEIARLSGLVSKYASLYTHVWAQNASMMDRIRELEKALRDKEEKPKEEPTEGEKTE